MRRTYDIRNEPERAIHTAAFDLAYAGETPERLAALEKAMQNNDVPSNRAVKVKECATLGALALRDRGDTPSR